MNFLIRSSYQTTLIEKSAKLRADGAGILFRIIDQQKVLMDF